MTTGLIKIPNGRHYKKWYFPSGELGLELKTDTIYRGHNRYEVYAEIKSAEDIMELLLFTNAFREYLKGCSYSLHLKLPYVPYGRQDRHTTKGSPFSLKVFADILNSMNYDSVEVATPHSNVTELLIDNCEAYDTYNFTLPGPVKDIVFVAPDAGAEKRVYRLAKDYRVPKVVVASKTRDPATGHIVGYSVPEIPNGKHLVVVDDICDGGATFIELAKHLPKDRKSLTLAVTHGIFSRGKQILFDSGYDMVYATYTFLDKGNNE